VLDEAEEPAINPEDRRGGPNRAPGARGRGGGPGARPGPPPRTFPPPARPPEAVDYRARK